MAQVRTPSHNHVQSSKIGGCTGAFFNLFDWNSSHRSAAIKRLPAERPEKSLGRSKSFRDDRSGGARGEVHRNASPASKTSSRGKDREVTSDDDTNTKPPGLVARLMGLESLPEGPFQSKHRRSRSFSGSESTLFPEKLVLRDLLKQEHKSSEKSLRDEILVVPVEHKGTPEIISRRDFFPSPVKSIVKYGDLSPGSCRSVYALPYVHKGEKSPFLTRLHTSPAHPSPVMQLAKGHNQMDSPVKSSPATRAKRASRFLEAAVKILEEISDNERDYPRESSGARPINDFEVLSPPSTGIDPLHCRSMRKVWRGSEDADSIGSRSNRSLASHGSVSFREPPRRDRICRDIFDTSFSELPNSLSPPPRRSAPLKGAVVTRIGHKEVKGSGILRTPEASVGGFKTDVRKSPAGVRRAGNEIVQCLLDRAHLTHQTARSAHEMKTAYSRITAVPSDFEENDYVTSDEESCARKFTFPDATMPRRSKALTDRSNFSKSPSDGASSLVVRAKARVKGNSEKQIIWHEERQLLESLPTPQLHGRSPSGGILSQTDGLQPVRRSRNRVLQENLENLENLPPASTSRILPTDIAKSRNVNSSIHPKQLSSHVDELRLSVRSRKHAAHKQGKQVVATKSTASPTLPRQSTLAAAPRPTERKSRQGGRKVRENSEPPSASREGEIRTAASSLHGNHRKKNSQAILNTRQEQLSGGGDNRIVTQISERGDDSTEQVAVQEANGSPQHSLNLDVGGHKANDHGNHHDNGSTEAALREDSNHSASDFFDLKSDVRVEGLETCVIIHGLEKLDQTQGLARGLFPVSDIGPNGLGELVLGMDDLHWDDNMVERPKEKSSRARYCEIQASGESLQLACDALDEDVCNVDDGSSPSPHKIVRECRESDMLDESSTAVFMKHFLGKPLRLDLDMGEISPSSVLDSPFGDCTTSDSSIAETEQREANSLEENDTMNLTDIVAELEREVQIEVSSLTTARMPTQETAACDKVRQALLDISSFNSLNHEHMSEFTKDVQISLCEEKTFVREVLSAAQLLSSPGRSPNWHEQDLAVDPFLFDKLEGGDSCSENDGFLFESGGKWRSDRRLLFDCINEAFSQGSRQYQDPHPWLRRPLLRNRPVQLKLVDEVHDQINEWRNLASHAIDTLLDIDMSTRAGKWTDFSEEVAEICTEVEGILWKVMMDEVVHDLVTFSH